MDPNFTMSGNEARMLMVALASLESSMPTSMTISLWLRLSQISNVQPPIEPEKEESND